MHDPYRVKECCSWAQIRAQVCTVAVALGFSSSWRVARDAFRYGGVVYLLVYSLALCAVALPAAVLQLAAGQLSQQDAVGVWRAVPFFRGVGYLRLLTSFLGATYTFIYVALTTIIFVYTIRNSIPFPECSLLSWNEDGIINAFNASDCLNETFMAPVGQKPEYYVAVSLIVVFLWVAFPFILYSPVKSMKRIFYICGPLVLIFAIVLSAVIGDKSLVGSIVQRSDWSNLLAPDVWFAALTQALMSSQLTGGYLLSAADTVYANRNCVRTSVVLIGTNLLAGWASVIFWCSISGDQNKDTSVMAVLVQTYKQADNSGLDIVWPLLVFAMLFFSGIITLLTLLYPLYDRIRRVGGVRWRVVSAGSSAGGVAATLALLAGRETAIGLLDEVAVPFLAALTAVLEIAAFAFIYGRKTLVEDIEFLIGQDLSHFWVIGWCVVPAVVVPLTTWWFVTTLVTGSWGDRPWQAATLMAFVGVSVLVFVVFAALSVAKQVQYDFVAKFKSSFRPSRHWGPRDPITHYYWLARREEIIRGTLPTTEYPAWQVGQHAISDSQPDQTTSENDTKKRANSDDWFWTGHRREHLEITNKDMYAKNKRRSRSLDWIQIVPDFRSM